MKKPFAQCLDSTFIYVWNLLCRYICIWKYLPLFSIFSHQWSCTADEFNSGKWDRTMASVTWRRENHLHLGLSVFTENPFAVWEKRYKSVPRKISVGLTGSVVFIVKSWWQKIQLVSSGWRTKLMKLNLLFAGLFVDAVFQRPYKLKKELWLPLKITTKAGLSCVLLLLLFSPEAIITCEDLAWGVL